MVVSSYEQLRSAILKEMKSAMVEASVKSKIAMEESVNEFYSGGKPVMYVRTGALANTPSKTNPVQQGNTVSFKTYLNKSGGYSTGKNPSMHAVLILTNNGAYPGLRSAVGKPGYWEKALTGIEDALNSSMASHFV